MKFVIKKLTKDAVDEIRRIAIKQKNMFDASNFSMKIMIGRRNMKSTVDKDFHEVCFFIYPERK